MEEKKTNLKESENTEPIHKHYSVSQSRILAGVILVVAGLLMIMKNAGFFTDFIDDVIFSWPMLLIVIGLLITVGSTENKVTGIIIMAVGAFFIIPVIFREAFHMYNMFWPSVFIIIGIILIIFGVYLFLNNFKYMLQGVILMILGASILGISLS